MARLPSELRRTLESAVTEARRQAEAAAHATLTTLAVFQPNPYPSMSDAERRLRNALRARTRSLGDGVERNGEPGLVEEIAYEAWHRMLFARFLAENDLLMHPSGAALTIELCDELAREERAAGQRDVDAWEVAARYAGAMLPGIFDASDPAVQAATRFAPEGRVALERILSGLPREVFTADDGLGWIYQFWQSENKDRVNASERKIGAEELPAVTQLFTEDYMVRFLLENSLGAWWAAHHPDSPLLKTFDYLRFRDDGTPAAGTFPGWPARTAEVTVMDPCCGSGHFLVAGFDMLRRIRMEEEGLDAAGAGDAVLRDNLFGLEIDPRCTQIAAFALALAAWKSGGYRELPLPQVACSGIAVTGQLETWRRLAGGDRWLADGLQRLYELFKQAPTLGSLIDPNGVPIQDRMFLPDFAEIEPLLAKALERERAADDPAAAVFGESARGVARAAKLLAGTYTLVATNVPFLGRGDQDEVLRKYCETAYPEGKANLATSFVERCRAYANDEGAGSFGLVTPHNWLFLTSYRKFRERLLREQTWNHVSRLGAGAFDEISGEVVNAALLVLTNQWPGNDQTTTGIDASSLRSSAEKVAALRAAPLLTVIQEAQLQNPDAVFSYADIDSSHLLGHYAYCYQGISTGDSSRLVFNFWDVTEIAGGWERFQVPPQQTSLFAGRECIVDWNTLRAGFDGSAIRGHGAWGKSGIAIGQMQNLPATFYQGTFFSNSTPVVIPNSLEHLGAVSAFCMSADFSYQLRRLNPKMSVDNGYVGKVPFDLERWQKVAGERYPDGLPEPYSNDPTQWLFKGNPADATEPLQVAVARLLGYRWPDQEPDRLDRFADEDGIVPLAALGGERPAADPLRELLAAAWGDAWSPAVEARLLAEAGFANRTLDDWLMNGFFEQHVRLFHNRPFVWHVWDGRKDGFSVLVNYHRLDGPKLDRLIYSYLGQSWIPRQRADSAANVPGADVRLAAALILEQKLKLIREGEQPYDVYVRWKPLHEQPIGWEPDLNDGVRLNLRPWIEPFAKASESPLRSKVNVNWKKDRGKNPDGSERHNDVHLSLAEKRAARESAQVGARR